MRKSFIKIVFIALTLPYYYCEAKTKTNGDVIYLADPTVFHYQGLYYLYGTESIPETGFPVLTSKDLTNWIKPKEASNNGYALLKGNKTFGSTGFWAPQVIHYNNMFYMLYTANENIAIAESNSPIGPFIQKTIAALPNPVKQIDPFLFFDDNGKKYLYHVRLGGGNKLFVAEMKDDLSGIKDETLTECITAQEGWEDTKRVPAPPITEGPTVIKLKDTYYLFYSANDFRNIDYAVGYATSKSPLGPWTKYSGNPIIHRSIVKENGSGHGDLFFDKKNNPYYVYHVHNSESMPEPRRTRIVPLKFVFNSSTNIYDISAKADSIIIPKIKM